jgi:hypothetical protein
MLCQVDADRNGCLDYGDFFTLFVLLKNIGNSSISYDLGQYNEDYAYALDGVTSTYVGNIGIGISHAPTF